MKALYYVRWATISSRRLIIIIITLWCAEILAYCAGASFDKQTEVLINQLPEISESGYGYGEMFSGSQFLPDPESSEVHTLVLGSQAPTNSAILERIVRRGSRAVPSLLKHLDDARETKLPPAAGMMWVSYEDEYDYNRRTRKDVPTGVNKESTIGQDQPRRHAITVGDLCFVALGQIVNRNFNATRYQPTGGLVVNSPTYSKRLCAVVRADFENFTEKKHRQLLVEDFLMPDFGDRRSKACRRLAFYYPETLEPLVLKQLAVPTYDDWTMRKFVGLALYKTESQEKRRAIFDEFVRSNGPAYSDGVLLQLFDDLGTQEADEQHRLGTPLKENEKHDARAILMQLYGYTDAVSSTNRPYITTWDNIEKALFIKSLGNYKSRKIDKAVSDVFVWVTDDDLLAAACMDRLLGKEHDKQIRDYCERRIPISKYFVRELQQVLAKLDSRKNTNK